MHVLTEFVIGLQILQLLTATLSAALICQLAQWCVGWVVRDAQSGRTDAKTSLNSNAFTREVERNVFGIQ